MKKSFQLFLLILTIIILQGCMKNYDGIYDDEEKIIQQGDSYSFIKSKRQSSQLYQKISFGEFGGINTLYTIDVEKEGQFSIDFKLKIDSGKLKLVLIDPNNDITVIVDQTDEDELTIDAVAGEYRIKMVGEEAKGSIEIDLTVESTMDVSVDD